MASYISQINVGIETGVEDWRLFWSVASPPDTSEEFKSITPIDIEKFADDDIEAHIEAVVPKGEDYSKMSDSEKVFLERIAGDVKAKVVLDETKQAEKEQAEKDAEVIEAGEVEITP
jgi:hypothetical protein